MAAFKFLVQEDKPASKHYMKGSDTSCRLFASGTVGRYRMVSACQAKHLTLCEACLDGLKPKR